MKKIVTVLLMTTLFMISACTNTSSSVMSSNQTNRAETITNSTSSDITSNQTDRAESTTNSTTEVVQYQIDPILYPSLKDLVDASEIIVVGEVTGSSIHRIDLTAEGSISGDTEMFANVSSFDVTVSKVMKGTIPSDMQLKVDLLCGGEVNGHIEIFEPEIPSPVVGEEYVFFIDAQEKNKDREYFVYTFEGSFDGFVKVENGVVEPNSNDESIFSESIFEKTDYDVFILEIQDLIV